MNKPPSSPSTPAVHAAAAPESAASPQRASTAAFSDGIKIRSGLADAFTEMHAPEARSALAGASFGAPASTKALKSADPPAAKKSPFKPKPPAIKPSDAKLGSESGNATPGQGEEKVIKTKSGLEVDQVTPPSAEDFNKRVKEAQKPVNSAEMEYNSETYAKVYQARERERLEAEKKKADEEAAKKHAHNATGNTQEQMMKNAALAHQARDLQAKMAILRSQLGQGDNSSTHAAIEECRVALAQIPAGLQG